MPRETLKDSASGMQCKAHGAQRPGQTDEFGEGASAVQLSDPAPAQQLIRRFPRFARWLGLSGLVIVLDQLTKLWIVSELRPGQSIELAGFLNLVFVYNPGAAFSFLSEAGGWQRWFFVVLALAVSAWLTFLIRRHAAERLLPLAASLIQGGALGNVVDRIRFGAVVDFVDVHAAGWHWPAFNVADSAITAGVALLVLQQLFPAAREKT